SLALDHLEGALDEIRFGKLAHADADRLGHRNLETHLVLLEIDHEKFELHARHFLFFNGGNHTDAMSRIHNGFTSLEALACGRFFLLGRHSSNKLPVTHPDIPPGPGQTRPDETGENRRGHSILVRPTCAKKQLHRGGDDTKTIVMSRGPRVDVLLLS